MSKHRLTYSDELGAQELIVCSEHLALELRLDPLTDRERVLDADDDLVCEYCAASPEVA